MDYELVQVPTAVVEWPDWWREPAANMPWTKEPGWKKLPMIDMYENLLKLQNTTICRWPGQKDGAPPPEGCSGAVACPELLCENSVYVLHPKPDRRHRSKDDPVAVAFTEKVYNCMRRIYPTMFREEIHNNRRAYKMSMALNEHSPSLTLELNYSFRAGGKATMEHCLVALLWIIATYYKHNPDEKRIPLLDHFDRNPASKKNKTGGPMQKTTVDLHIVPKGMRFNTSRFIEEEWSNSLPAGMEYHPSEDIPQDTLYLGDSVEGAPCLTLPRTGKFNNFNPSRAHINSGRYLYILSRSSTTPAGKQPETHCLCKYFVKYVSSVRSRTVNEDMQEYLKARTTATASSGGKRRRKSKRGKAKTEKKKKQHKRPKKNKTNKKKKAVQSVRTISSMFGGDTSEPQQQPKSTVAVAQPPTKHSSSHYPEPAPIVHTAVQTKNSESVWRRLPPKRVTFMSYLVNRTHRIGPSRLRDTAASNSKNKYKTKRKKARRKRKRRNKKFVDTDTLGSINYLTQQDADMGTPAAAAGTASPQVMSLLNAGVADMIADDIQ